MEAFIRKLARRQGRLKQFSEEEIENYCQTRARKEFLALKSELPLISEMMLSQLREAPQLGHFTESSGNLMLQYSHFLGGIIRKIRKFLARHFHLPQVQFRIPCSAGKVRDRLLRSKCPKFPGMRFVATMITRPSKPGGPGGGSFSQLFQPHF